MRRISRLTQPEFAKHRGISLVTLRKIETGNVSVNVETLNKIGDIFGLEVGFVKKVIPVI
jgi:DNA-binding XRE family transcriptional regulator